MSARDFLSRTGIPSTVWIDGEPLPAPTPISPKTWGLPRSLRQSGFTAMNGTTTVTAAYDGDGLPVIQDTFSFSFPFDLDPTYADLAAMLEILTTSGGVHTMAFQKAMAYTYELRAGQSGFWMRGDVAAQGFLGFDSPSFVADVLIPAAGVPNPVTVYKPTVTAGDSVTAGEVWISEAVYAHPTSGKHLAFCKLGSPPSVRATMTVASFQLFRVVITDTARIYPNVAMEESTLICVETN